VSQRRAGACGGACWIPLVGAQNAHPLADASRRQLAVSAATPGGPINCQACSTTEPGRPPPPGTKDRQPAGWILRGSWACEQQALHHALAQPRQTPVAIRGSEASERWGSRRAAAAGDHVRRCVDRDRLPRTWQGQLRSRNDERFNSKPGASAGAVPLKASQARMDRQLRSRPDLLGHLRPPNTSPHREASRAQSRRPDWRVQQP